MFQSLNPVKSFVNFRLRADKLRQSYLRKRVFDNFVKPDNDGANPAIAFMNARIQNARIIFTMFAQNVRVQDFNDFV